MTSGDLPRRTELLEFADEVGALHERVRAGLQAWRDVVLDAVLAVIIPNADAAVLRSAAVLLQDEGLTPERLLFFVEPRRAQLTDAFASKDPTGDDGGALDVETLSIMRAGLQATRDAIRADLAHRRAAIARKHPGQSASDNVATQRWRLQDEEQTESGPIDDVLLALEGALREVNAELADNARLLRRRQEAEVGLLQLDAAVIGDARALGRDRLQECLLDVEGADRFDRDIAPFVLARDRSAAGVLRATRSLSTALRILDAMRNELLDPVRTAWPIDDVRAQALTRRCTRISLWCHAAAAWRDWGHIGEDESVWNRIFAVVDAAFSDVGEAIERDGTFLSVVHHERASLATGPLHDVGWGQTAEALADGASGAVFDRIDRYTIVRRIAVAEWATSSSPARTVRVASPNRSS